MSKQPIALKHQEKIIDKCSRYIRSCLITESSGHDWLHIQRVVNNALYIHRKEGGDLFVIYMAALLHEMNDYKLKKYFPKGLTLNKYLNQLSIDANTISSIASTLKNISFRDSFEQTTKMSIEAKIIQDADRLDSIGAVGIARVFAFGGKNNRQIHNPNHFPLQLKSSIQYIKNQSSSINHFHEKLLKVKDLMNTRTAKKLALRRHNFMLYFLNEFEFEQSETLN